MTIMIDTFLISVFSSSLAAFGMFLWQIVKCNLYFLDHIKRFPINAHFMCVIVVFALIMTVCNIFCLSIVLGILVFVHRWWAPAKFDPVKSPMLFFEKDKPVIPPVQPNVGLDMVLKHMVVHWMYLFT